MAFKQKSVYIYFAFSIHREWDLKRGEKKRGIINCGIIIVKRLDQLNELDRMLLLSKSNKKRVKLS